MAWIEAVLLFVAGYASLGLVVGVVGLVALAPKADPSLRDSGWSLRLLLLPGIVAVWPIAVWRWGLGRGGGR